jgi:hypothetical protein
VPALVAHWLGCNGQRDEITRAARARVLSSFTYADRARTLAHVAVSEGAALVASRRLSEATAAALVLEQYLQERRWSALLGRGWSLLKSARLRAASVVWAGIRAKRGRQRRRWRRCET